MRAGEIEAISTALKVLGDRVKPADAEANKRALLQQPEKQTALKAILSKAQSKVPVKSTVADAKTKSVEVTKPSAKSAPITEAKKLTTEAKLVPAKKTAASFLQRAEVKSQSADQEL